MAKKTTRQLDDEIAAFRLEQYHSHRAGPIHAHGLPTFSEKKGGWIGGDTRTLYTFSAPHWTDIVVRNGQGARGITSLGNGKVRVATQAEARKHWSADLDPSWVVTR